MLRFWVSGSLNVAVVVFTGAVVVDVVTVVIVVVGVVVLVAVVVVAVVVVAVVVAVVVFVVVDVVFESLETNIKYLHSETDKFSDFFSYDALKFRLLAC